MPLWYLFMVRLVSGYVVTESVVIQSNGDWIKGNHIYCPVVKNISILDSIKRSFKVTTNDKSIHRKEIMKTLSALNMKDHEYESTKRQERKKEQEKRNARKTKRTGWQDKE